MAQGHLPQLNFPYRVAATAPIIGQKERLELLRAALNETTDIRPHVRVAMVLLLLFAQPLSRIVEFRSEQLDVAADGAVSLTGVGLDPLVVMAPFDAIFRDFKAARPNMNTAANPTSGWLFPGVNPGRHLTASALMANIRDEGIDLRGAKNAALRKLVLTMPAALVADAFGYSYERTEIHSKSAGKQFADYAGLSVDSLPNDR